MEPVAISWLVASASSPLIAVLALWTVYVFHTYRKRWRTVDLFLLAVASQELISAVFTFSYAIISLINPPISALCSFIQWGLISVRTFQIATLTSMVVDRALTVRWPYRYRFSVRRNQIRYHIAVLALMSILVGVAAVFAHVPDVDNGMMCSGHPMEWDFKFVVFVLGFYGVLVFLSLICTVQIEVHKCRNGGKHQAKGMPYQLPDCSSSELPVTTAVTSPLDNESHTGSTRTLHRPYRHSSRRPYGKKTSGASDFRWPPVAVVSLICFSVNHLPYLVLTSLATAMPWLWSSWHEAMLSWMRLAEGVLVPLVLCIVDQPVRAALKRTFQRRSGALSPLVGDDGPLQMYFDKDHFRKRGAFGSVTPIGIITNYRRTPGKKRRNKKCKYKLPGLHDGDSIIEKSCLSNNFLSTEPLSKLSCADLTNLEVWQEEDEENFYATLSDDVSTFSCNSADENTANDETKICDDLYGGSFTTIANDDFEFHDTRPCGGEVRMRPSLTEEVPRTSSFRGSMKDKLSNKENHSRQNALDPVQNGNESNLMNVTFQSEDDKKDPSIFQTMEKKSENDANPEPDVTKVTENENSTSPSLAKTKNSWFSMNDLDLIEKNVVRPQEKVLVLPVKSESTMSLYRLRLEKDVGELLPATKSENNVNDDSGFGSGTQTMNPIWPGYLLHNTSDPLGNNRKVIPPGIGPRKHYPCILHPRMQKIPWISAWKKLGGNNMSGSKHKLDKMPHSRVSVQEASCGVLLINDNFQLRQREDFRWKDSDIYGKDITSNDYNINFKETNRNDSRQREPKRNAYLQRESSVHEPTKDNYVVHTSKEKKRKSRKNSFREIVEKSGPYGKVGDFKQIYGELPVEHREENYLEKEENIYEEIVSQTSCDETHQGENKTVFAPEEKSYARTDILKLGVINGSVRRDHENNAVNLRMGLYGNEGIQPPSSFADRMRVLENPTTTSSFQTSQQQYGVLDGLQRSAEDHIAVFSEGVVSTLANYNDVNVTYSVNGNLLEFIDSTEYGTDNLVVPGYREYGTDCFDQDVNANNRQETREKEPEDLNDPLWQYGQRSSGRRRELPEPTRKDAAIKRRESRKNKTTRTVDTTDPPDSSGIRRPEHYPIIRRESDSRHKHREGIKRRGSSCKDSREVIVARKESDRRGKRVKSDTGLPDGLPPRKKDIPKVHRKDSSGGLWNKDSEPRLTSVEKWENRFNSDHSEHNQFVRNDGGYSRIGSGEIIRSTMQNNRELSCSSEKLNSNDFVRLKCGYSPVNTNYNVADVPAPPPPPPAVRQDISRILPRSYSDGHQEEMDDFWNRRRRSEVVAVTRKESQKDDKRAKFRRTDEASPYQGDNRVRRKHSTGRESRKNSDLESKEAVDGNLGRRIRRQESLNKDAKYRTGFSDVDDAQVKKGNVGNDVNRNEGAKLNTDITNESVRMDNLVYDRRDNGNFENDTEIFPFETFVKPPPYHLVRYQVGPPDRPDYRDRVKQKKVAVTDYL